MSRSRSTSPIARALLATTLTVFAAASTSTGSDTPATPVVTPPLSMGESNRLTTSIMPPIQANVPLEIGHLVAESDRARFGLEGPVARVELWFETIDGRSQPPEHRSTYDFVYSTQGRLLETGEKLAPQMPRRVESSFTDARLGETNSSFVWDEQLGERPFASYTLRVKDPNPRAMHAVHTKAFSGNGREPETITVMPEPGDDGGHTVRFGTSDPAETYRFSARGRLVSLTTGGNESAVDWEGDWAHLNNISPIPVSFRLDDRGRVIESRLPNARMMMMMRRAGPADEPVHHRYIYEDDERGNWTRLSVEQHNAERDAYDTILVVERVITYHD